MATRCMPPIVLAIAACQDLPDIEYEGEKVRVGMYVDATLCAGDIARLDAFVRQLEDDLDAHSDERIDVYLYDLFDPPSSISDHCNRGGCFDPKDHHVISSQAGLQHELVHAVVHRVGDPRDMFFNEGIPEALLDQRTIFGQTLPSDNLGRDERARGARESLDDRTAGHFHRWLWHEHDRDAFRRLARGSSFEAAFGFPFADAEAQYLADAPWSYPRRSPCAAPPMQSVGDHAWDETFAASCDDEGTFTIDRYRGWGAGTEEYEPLVARTIEIVDGGVYNISWTPWSDVALLGCQLEPVADPPRERGQDERDFWDQIFEDSHPYEPFERTRLFTFDGVLQIELRPGSYEVIVGGSHGETDPVRVMIAPALQARRIPD